MRYKYILRTDLAEVTGSPAFDNYSRSIGESISKHTQEKNAENPLVKWFSRYSPELDRYFLNLIIIFGMIAKQPKELRPFYSDILKAQLSPSEVKVLFWFGLFSVHGYRVKPHLENLAFFKDAHLSEAVEEFISQYASSAFGIESSRE